LRRALNIRETALRASPTEDFAEGLLQMWQPTHTEIYGLPLLLPNESEALDLAMRTALLNKSRTQDVGALVRQALRSKVKTDEQRGLYAQMQQKLSDRAKLLDVPGGEDEHRQAQNLLWEAQQINQTLARQLGVAGNLSIPGVDQILEAVAAKLPL